MWKTVTALETEFFTPCGAYEPNLSSFIDYDISMVIIILFYSAPRRTRFAEEIQRTSKDPQLNRKLRDYSRLMNTK